MTVTHELAVTLEASTSVGSVSQNLQGFTIQKNTSTMLQVVAGNPATDQSLDVSVTVAMGSVDVSATWG